MYHERASRLPGAVVWHSTTDPGACSRILPDGCMDLIWDGSVLELVGPDRRARRVEDPAGRERHAIRFAPGDGPAVVGVAACDLVDRQVPVDQLWAPSTARAMADRLASSRDPGGELEAICLAQQARSGPAVHLAHAVVELCLRGVPVATMARTLGWSDRHLRRLCLDAFGYGPKTLGRILRFRAAVADARRGAPLADVAAWSGYADQAHLARDARDLAGVTMTELVGRPLR